MSPFVKRRAAPTPGTIPAALDIFRSELRFYREIAPDVGVRVPACLQAEETSEGDTRLVLEDLSDWHPGARADNAARVLRHLHDRWQDVAATRFPWLRPVGAAADMVTDLFSQTAPRLAARRDLGEPARELLSDLVGTVTAHEMATVGAGTLTLVHGDASLGNMRTGPTGEIVLLDWEDVSCAPGVVDLAWLLVSSVDPDRWDRVAAAYGPHPGLALVLPAAAVQGFLSLADEPEGSAAAAGWSARLACAARRLAA